MKINITKEDVLALREELLQYAEKAEQHEFPKILLVHLKLDQSDEQLDKLTPEDLNAMFRVVYGIIGKDFSEYKEEEETKWKNQFLRRELGVAEIAQLSVYDRFICRRKQRGNP